MSAPQPASAIMRIDWSRVSRQWQSAPNTSPAVQRVCTRTNTGSAGRAVVGIAGKACRSALERRAARAQVAADQRDVALAPVHLRLVGDHAKLAVACLDAALARANDIALVAKAVADEFGDREDAQSMLLAKRDQVRNARHLAVVAHDLADHACRSESCHAGQIDRSLGLAGAHKHAAAARSKRKRMSRPRKV